MNSLKQKEEKFRRNERILNKKQFDLIFKSARRTRHKGFLLLTRENKQGYPRLGVVLSRKVGNAVYRNSLRRISREWFRINKQNFPALDLVLIFQSTKTKDLPKHLADQLTQIEPHSI